MPSTPIPDQVLHRLHSTLRSVLGRAGHLAPDSIPNTLAPWESLNDLCQTALDSNPAILWTTIATVDLNHWDMLGISLSLGPTLGDSLRTLGRYLRLLSGRDVVDLRFVDEGVHVVIHADSNYPAVRAGLCVLFSIIGRTLKNQRDTESDGASIIRATLKHPLAEPCLEIARRTLGCSVLGGEPLDVLVLSGPTLNIAAPTCLGCVLPETPKLPVLLPNWTQMGPVSQRVSSVVRDRLLQGIPHMTAVASELNMSVPLLANHLKQEGTAFFSLREDVLSNLTRHLLTETNLPVHDVALLSGFLDFEVFCRTVNRWFGTSAEQVRLRAKPDIR